MPAKTRQTIGANLSMSVRVPWLVTLPLGKGGGSFPWLTSGWKPESTVRRGEDMDSAFVLCLCTSFSDALNKGGKLRFATC